MVRVVNVDIVVKVVNVVKSGQKWSKVVKVSKRPKWSKWLKRSKWLKWSKWLK